jgi:hypothetical protein
LRPRRLAAATVRSTPPAGTAGRLRRRHRPGAPPAAVAADGAATAEEVARLMRATRARIRTLPDCELAVSIYPRFAYDAGGGGGTGTAAPLPGAESALAVEFDPSTLAIPALNFKTASIFGLPIPPPLNIAITPRRLAGTVQPATGIVQLEFDAQFEFTAGPLYAAPPLLVRTTLTTESSSGEIHAATGRRMAPGGGSARLVGVARVPQVGGDILLNAFLQLPTDALAVLSCELEFD